MNRAKKLISLALAAAMVLSLAACGKTGGESNPEDDGEITLNVGIQIRANVESVVDNDLTRWLEEKTGYNIEFTEFSTDASEWRSQFNTMIAAGEKLPDIMFGFGWNDVERYTYGADGYLVDIQTLFANEELSAEYKARMDELYGEGYFEEMLKYLRSPNGAVYGFPSASFSYPKGTNTFSAYINTTWLKNLGLEMPTNWDELVTVLRAFKEQDPNGNGKMDEIPAVGLVGASTTTTATTGYDLPSWLLNNFLYIDDSKVFNSENGKLSFPYITDEYRKGLQALNDLVDEGLLSTLCWTMDQASKELDAIIGPANGVAIAGVVGGLQSKMPNLSPTMWEYEGLLPFNYAPMKMNIPEIDIFLTEDCENPEAAFKLVAAMATEEGSMLIRYGVEGRDWEWKEDDTLAGKGVNQIIQFTAGGHKVNWGVNYGSLLRFDRNDTPYHAVKDPTAEWHNEKNARGDAHYNGYVAAAEERNPDEIVDKLLYTVEEQDNIGNVNTDVLIYVKESRAKFATGVLDPYDDATWNEYLKNLEDMGLQIWLDNAQSAWDRMNSK